MSGWAIDPQFGRNHAAAFEAEKPFGFERGTTLTFMLQFKNNTSHALGRPRLSITTATKPLELTGDGMSEQALAALRTPAEQRNAEQKAALLAWYRAIDSEWCKLNQRVQDHLAKAPKPKLVKAMISSEGLPAVRLHTQGDDFLKETHFLNRGDPNQKEGQAPQGYLQVLMTSADGEKHWQPQPPAGSRTSYRRRALAEWLTDVEHGAGRLLARVIVNRLWQHHFGQGLVRTPSNFGKLGEAPTHPELLDHLASEFVRHGWSLKWLHREIMLPSTYQQSSRGDVEMPRRDPDNRLLWKMKRQRLDYLLDHVIEWLEHTCDMSWRKFTEHKEQLDAVERMYQEEDLLQKHIEWLEELKAMPRPTCPTCDSTDQVVPIFYDLPETQYPPADLYVLGECGVLPDSPGWHCKECSTAILNTGVENPGWPSSGLLGDDSRL